MAMEIKEFEKKVRAMRRMFPAYSNGRKVVLLSEYSKKGKQILDSASQWDGADLQNVYSSYSESKRQAYNECYEMYCNSRHGSMFGICSHNCQGFTVSWVSDDGVHFVTPKTEYLVICNE